MRKTLLKSLLLITVFAPQVSQAVIISNISIVNRSVAEEATVLASGRVKEFHTGSSIGSVQSTGSTQEVTTQFQWYNGYKGVGGFAQIHRRQVAYDLFFTITDASNSGYTLDIDTLLQGYSTSSWTGSTNLSHSSVISTATSLSGRIDTDTSDANDTLGTQLNDLTILSSNNATANQNNAFVHSSLTSKSDSYLVGDFIGTRSFSLRFTSGGTPTTNVILQNYQKGQGSVNYGLANTLSELDLTADLQASDISRYDLGHFVNIKLSNLTPNVSAVPEPSSFLLFSLGLAGLGFVKGRKKA